MLNNKLIEACKKGNIEQCEKIYNKYKLDIHAENDFVFRNACLEGNLKIIQWVLTFGEKPDIHANDDEIFRNACDKRRLDIAKWLYGLKDKPNIHINDEEVFRNACKNSNIDIAKWLYGLEDKPNIHAKDNEVFKNIYKYKQYLYDDRYIDIAKWLLTLENNINIDININENDDFIIAFRKACDCGNMDLVQWLYGLGYKSDIHIIDEAFRNVCFKMYEYKEIYDYNKLFYAYDTYDVYKNKYKNKHLKIAKWMMTLDNKPNIRANNDEVFRHACSFEHLEIAEWLLTLCDNYYIKIENNKITSWKIKDRMQDLYNNK